MLATEAGKIAWKAQLDVYGVPREEPLAGADAAADAERTSNPWRFPGQYEDEETGLYYNRFRYYDPELGRYRSEDPIGLLGGTALYGYVHDPLGWLDALGLACVKANRRSGKAAEDFAEDAIDIMLPGMKRLGRQVTIDTSRGRRVIDLVYEGPGKVIYLIEVKAGGATRSGAQVAKDSLIDAGMGVFKGKNAGDLAGQGTKGTVSILLDRV